MHNTKPHPHPHTMDDPTIRKSGRKNISKNLLKLTCYQLSQQYCPAFCSKNKMFICSFCDQLLADLPLMSKSKRAKSTGPNPARAYKCIRFNSKLYNLIKFKVVYDESTKDIVTTEEDGGGGGVETEGGGVMLRLA